MTDPFAEETRQRAIHDAKTDRVRDRAGESFRFFISVAVIAILLRSLFFAPFNIPSESMLPRLLVGDYLFVAKWSYGYSRYSFPFGLAPISGRIFGRTPERGDVLVFKNPRDNREDYIKRVIGLPGDLIQMRGGQIVLNGTPIPKIRMADFVMPISPNTSCHGVPGAPDFERADTGGRKVCSYPRYRETLPSGRSYEVLDEVQGTPQDDTGVYVVPDNHYFMLGDNRDNSADSRFPVREIGGGVGFVPAQNLVGRATMMFFSTDGSANWFLPWTWFTAARWQRIGQTF